MQADKGVVGHVCRVPVRPGLELERRCPIQEGGDQELVAGLGDKQGEGKGGKDSDVNKAFVCSFVLDTGLGVVWRLLVLMFHNPTWCNSRGEKTTYCSTRAPIWGQFIEGTGVSSTTALLKLWENQINNRYKLMNGTYQAHASEYY